MKRKVEEPTYNGAHYRVVKERGYAVMQKCTDCKRGADQWSQIRGTTGFDPCHYEPRCRSCHNKYDYDTNNFTKLTPDAVSEIRRAYETGAWLQRELAEEYGVTQPTISAIVNNSTWKGSGK